MVRFTKSNGESRTTPRISRKDRGQSLVELAFALPIFLVLVMGVIDFSWGLKSWISITNASREAARWGAVYCNSGDYTDADVVDRAENAAHGLDMTNFSASVNTTDGVTCDGGANSTESLVVDVQYDYELITPLGGLMSMFGGGLPDSITLNSSADMRIE